MVNTIKLSKYPASLKSASYLSISCSALRTATKEVQQLLWPLEKLLDFVKQRSALTPLRASINLKWPGGPTGKTKGSGEIEAACASGPEPSRKDSNICTKLPTPLNLPGAYTLPTPGRPLEANLVAVLCEFEGGVALDALYFRHFRWRRICQSGQSGQSSSSRASSRPRRGVALGPAAVPLYSLCSLSSPSRCF